MQITAPTWIEVVEKVVTLVVIPLAAAFVGAHYGATKAHEVAKKVKDDEEDRRRRALASALLWEIEVLGIAFLNIDEWDGQQTLGANGTPALDAYLQHLELFDENTTSQLLRFRDAWQMLTLALETHGQLPIPNHRGQQDSQAKIKAFARETVLVIPALHRNLLAYGVVGSRIADRTTYEEADRYLEAVSRDRRNIVIAD